jgi:hypothetical protein
MLALLLPALLVAQVRVTVQTGSGPDSVPQAPDSIHARRIPVTEEHLRTAFKDDRARALLLGARAARMQQDSALIGYDATTYQRISVGMSLLAIGRDRLMFRHESATHVQWARGVGAIIEVKGARTVMPMIFSDKNDSCRTQGQTSTGSCVQADMSGISPIPYFPGSESLLIGSGLAKAEVDENDLIHPLAQGAEAYYKYQSGDSLLIHLQGGRTIFVEELRVLPRSPKWNLSVGSFWFDRDTHKLVRAVYRLAVPMDVWEMSKDDGEDPPPAAVRALVSPLRGTISAITVEYGLFEEHFWLPRTETFEGNAQASFMHFPFTLEERFEYTSVNGDYRLPPIPRPPRWDTLDSLAAFDSLARGGDTTSARLAKEMRARMATEREQQRERARVIREARQDTLRQLDERAKAGDAIAKARADSLRLRLESARRVCDTATVRTRVERRFGNLPVMTRTPCDENALIHSPDLPLSIYEPGEKLFGGPTLDELRSRLDFGLQAEWAPQRPTIRYGLGDGMMRYNRVEGFSPAIVVADELGRGFSAKSTVRVGFADTWLNAELGITRDNGVRTVGVNVYRRLTVASDWGTPLNVGNSLSAVLFGRDEGFYYRAWGAELTATTEHNPALVWRVFAEHQQAAPVSTQFSVAHAMNDVQFIPNIPATRGTIVGVSARVVHSLGYDPNGWRLLTELRAENGVGDFAYARGLADMTVSHSLGRRLAGSLTGSAGLASEQTPPQRLFYLGGAPTVRGQKAGTDAGTTYWFGRAELGTSGTGARRVVFADLGWAGTRSMWSHPGRPMSGVGVGTSFMDGLFRFDLSKGIFPRKSFRFDAYIEARF